MTLVVAAVAAVVALFARALRSLHRWLAGWLGRCVVCGSRRRFWTGPPFGLPWGEAKRRAKPRNPGKKSVRMA